MERLFPTIYPVRTVEGSRDVLATLDENVHEDVQGVCDLGCAVKRRDLVDDFDLDEDEFSFNAEDVLPR